MHTLKRFLSGFLVLLTLAVLLPAQSVQATGLSSRERFELNRQKRQLQKVLREGSSDISKMSQYRLELNRIRQVLRGKALQEPQALSPSVPVEMDTAEILAEESRNSRLERYRSRRNRLRLSPVRLSKPSIHKEAKETPAAVVETGKASYYADMFNGRTTASGTTFSNQDMTAAHKTLPFGTVVRVTNPQNGNQIVVTITDRGPFVEGRIIDLTKAGFAQLDNLSRGVIPVEVEVIK